EKSARVLAAEKGVVLEIDGQLTYDFPGRYAFPELPSNLLSKPTLVWLLDSKQPEQRVDVTYLTDGLAWNADYVLVLSADDKAGDLMGWVTLSNESGTAYENAELKLVAGDVERVSPPVQPEGKHKQVFKQPAQPAQEFQRENLFEYHLYTLSRPTTV